MSKVLNDLYDYVPYKIYQDEDYFKFSLDSVLLAEFVKQPEKKKNILELCAGNCAVSMILSTKTKADITAIEIQKEIYDLAINSIKHNKMNINVINDDAKNYKKYFPGNKFDAILCNPPYFKKDSKSYVNDEMIKAIARHELTITLEDIISISSALLDIDGELYLVHRTDRIDEIIILCNKYNLNVKNIQFIETKENTEPRLALFRCVRASRFGVKILPNLCIDGMKSFKNIFWKR